MLVRRITLEDVERMREMRPRRKRFSEQHVVYQKDDGIYVVSAQFASIARLFEEETGITTKDGKFGPFCFLNNQDQIDAALQWQADRSNLIFLRDTLDCSIALAYNFSSAAEYTELGRAEHDAKQSRDSLAIKTLAKACVKVVTDIPFYLQSDAVCAVPPAPGKPWDLPTEITRLVAVATGKVDLSSAIKFTKPKGSVKSVSLANKWQALEAGALTIDKSVKGKKVILIDDKYQSGTTAQFVAAKLFDAGAVEVNGLFCVKTWRDTDNT